MSLLFSYSSFVKLFAPFFSKHSMVNRTFQHNCWKWYCSLKILNDSLMICHLGAENSLSARKIVYIILDHFFEAVTYNWMIFLQDLLGPIPFPLDLFHFSSQEILYSEGEKIGLMSIEKVTCSVGLVIFSIDTSLIFNLQSIFFPDWTEPCL